MSHVTEVVKFEKVGQQQWAVTIRCCNDPRTDFSHTMGAAVMADAENKKASLAAAHAACAKNHEAVLKAAADAEQLIGESQQHDS